MRQVRPVFVLAFSCSLMLACDPPAPEKQEKAPSPASVGAPTEGEPTVGKDKKPAVAEVPPVADFAVHEWGMMRHTAEAMWVVTSPPSRWGFAGSFGGGHGEGLSGGGTAPGLGKPLVMLYPGPAFDTKTEISVSVELVGGTLREVWPTPEQGAQPTHGTSYTWTGLHVLGEPCGRELAPAPEHIACTSIATAGLCEAAEMGDYLVPVPNCLSLGTVKTPALVYNGQYPGAPAPLVLGEGDAAILENRTTHAFGPLYLHQGDALFRIETLEANGKVARSAALPFAGELSDAVRKDLVAKGLTEGEADSFVAAWSPDVLSQSNLWQVFGFYSAEGIEAIAPMTVTPQPKEIVRVMAVTIE